MSKSGPDTPSQDQSNNLDTERRPRADWDRLFALAAQAAERSPDRQFAVKQHSDKDLGKRGRSI